MPRVRTRPVGDDIWVLAVMAGVLAAMHVWKLPTAIPMMRTELGISLIDAGLLLGVIQVGGMAFGLLLSLFIEMVGLRRALFVGMTLLVIGTLMGALARSFGWLLIGRFTEGIGFLLATVIAPGLIRRLAPPSRLNLAVGIWGAYQGAATFLALTVSAVVMTRVDWRVWYWAMATATVAVALLLFRLPPDPPGTSDVTAARRRVVRTARSPRVWVAGAAFGCYTAQWMAVIGFLPTIYQQNGISTATGGFLSAVAGGVNIFGSLLSGYLLHRGVLLRRLLIPTFVVMAVASVLTFQPDWSRVAGGFWFQFGFVCLFSAVGSVIPTSLIRLAVDLAPSGGSAPAAMGLMQQLYTMGSFVGPPLMAWLVTRTGTWQHTWWMTVAFATAGVAMALLLSERRLGLSLRTQ